MVENLPINGIHSNGVGHVGQVGHVGNENSQEGDQLQSLIQSATAQLSAIENQQTKAFQIYFDQISTEMKRLQQEDGLSSAQMTLSEE